MLAGLAKLEPPCHAWRSTRQRAKIAENKPTKHYYESTFTLHMLTRGQSLKTLVVFVPLMCLSLSTALSSAPIPVSCIPAHRTHRQGSQSSHVTTGDRGLSQGCQWIWGMDGRGIFGTLAFLIVIAASE